MKAVRYLLLITLANFTDIAWSQESDELFANGFARYTDLGKEVYIGGLYLGLPSSNPESIREYERKRMEIKITAKSLSTRRFARMFVKNAAINNSPQLLTQNAVAMEQFLSWFKDTLSHGDHIVIENTASGFDLSINSVKLAAIQSDNLFNMLLNTWIGNVPPSRDFKTDILGDSRGQDIEYDFSSLTPTSQRIAAIRNWKEAEEKRAIAEIEAKRAAEQRELAKAQAEKRALQQAAAKAQRQQQEKAKAAQLATIAKQKEEDAKRIAAENARRASENEFSAENLLAEQLYANQLMIHSQKKMIYPEVSRRLGHQGRVVVNVTIDRNGKIVNYELSEESKHKPLNNAVKKGIRKAAPYPEIPEKIQGETFDFQVPVNFQFSS